MLMDTSHQGWLAFLQPHGRHRTERQPAVGVDLPLPQGGRANRFRGARGSRRRPAAPPRRAASPGSPSASCGGRCSGGQAGRDVQQQKLTVERHPGRRRPVHHDDHPGRHSNSANQREPALLHRGLVVVLYHRLDAQEIGSRITPSRLQSPRQRSSRPLQPARSRPRPTSSAIPRHRTGHNHHAWREGLSHGTHQNPPPPISAVTATIA